MKSTIERPDFFKYKLIGKDMKTYDKRFLHKLAKNLNIPEREFNQKLYLTEKQIMNLPDEFEYDKLVELTCDEYKISEDEFHSFYRYGELGKARQSVCYIMSLMGFKNKRIAKITGFKPSNISASVRIISADLNALNHINNILEIFRTDETD